MAALVVAIIDENDEVGGISGEGARIGIEELCFNEVDREDDDEDDEEEDELLLVVRALALCRIKSK